MSEPIKIPLKYKYRHAVKTRYPINGDHQGNKHSKKRKIGQRKHEELYGPTRQKVLVIKPNGGRVFRDVS